MRLATLFIVLMVPSLFAQVEAPTSKPNPTIKKATVSDADKILKEVDSRIYYAKNYGLKSFQFRMSMDHGTGNLEKPLKGVFMQLSWKAPDKWRTDLVDAKGKPSPKLAELLATKEGKAVLSSWQSELKGMALHLIIGMPWSEKFAKHFKKVKSTIVNNKREYKITMHPDRKRFYSEAVIKIVNGIPRRLVYVTTKGERFISRFLYAKREKYDDKWLWTGVEQEQDSRKIRLEGYDYLTRENLLILSQLKRVDFAQSEMKTKFKVLDFIVNPQFAPGYFKPVPAPVKKTN
ncbi:MAG: hypothetical protein ACI97A_004075 [Planctomycetota bacterium]|jgi:hypothetical protein